ncbi:hypothetical protein DVJ77_09920 [Dyella tabacisoli]|uniref:Uncharacterized protein n=2 Tax=Dyella tabacisoli TaxID=2282381 RepID=A0A369ULT2_9GAMM|nr:hypothetical protein DVJ77_09920 [Dyella tabacisoli]
MFAACFSVVLTAIITAIRLATGGSAHLSVMLGSYAAWLPLALLTKGLLAYAWAQHEVERGQRPWCLYPAKTVLKLALILTLASFLISMALAPLNAAYIRWLMESSVLRPLGWWAALPLLKTAGMELLSLAVDWFALVVGLRVANEREVGVPTRMTDAMPAARWWFAAAFFVLFTVFLSNASGASIRLLGSPAGTLHVMFYTLLPAALAFACARYMLRKPSPMMQPLRLAACAGVVALLSAAVIVVVPVLMYLLMVALNSSFSGASAGTFAISVALLVLPVFPLAAFALWRYRANLPVMGFSASAAE